MRKGIQNSIIGGYVVLVTVFPKVAFGAWNINVTRQDAAYFGVSTSTPSSILMNIVNYALALIGILGILGFIIAGIMYLLSAGDEDVAKRAKGYMVNAIIGVIVALIGFVLIAAISTLLGAGGAVDGL